MPIDTKLPKERNKLPDSATELAFSKPQNGPALKIRASCMAVTMSSLKSPFSKSVPASPATSTFDFDCSRCLVGRGR